MSTHPEVYVDFSMGYNTTTSSNSIKNNIKNNNTNSAESTSDHVSSKDVIRLVVPSDNIDVAASSSDHHHNVDLFSMTSSSEQHDNKDVPSDNDNDDELVDLAPMVTLESIPSFRPEIEADPSRKGKTKVLVQPRRGSRDELQQQQQQQQPSPVRAVGIPRMESKLFSIVIVGSQQQQQQQQQEQQLLNSSSGAGSSGPNRPYATTDEEDPSANKVVVTCDGDDVGMQTVVSHGTDDDDDENDDDGSPNVDDNRFVDVEVEEQKRSLSLTCFGRTRPLSLAMRHRRSQKLDPAPSGIAYQSRLQRFANHRYHPGWMLILLMLSLTVEIASVVVYIVSVDVFLDWADTPQPGVDDFTDHEASFLFQSCVSVYFSIAWLLWLVGRGFIRQAVFSSYTFICCFTCFLMNFISLLSIDDYDSYAVLWVPFFLRIWIVLGYLRSLLNNTYISANMVTREIILNVWVVVSIFITFASLFQISEAFADEEQTWYESLYFVTVTLSTVGYGDVVPNSFVAKLWTILLVFITVGIIPTLLSHITELSQVAAHLRALKPKEHRPHVVLCGRLDVSVMSSFLNEFVAGNRRHYNIRLVFLSSVEYSDEARVLLKNPMWSFRVETFRGDAKDFESLHRVAIETADAVFVVRDTSMPSWKGDEECLHRCWNLHYISSNVPAYVALRLDKNASLLNDRIISLTTDRLKYCLLGQAVLSRGLIPLCVNLIQSADDRPPVGVPWFDDYNRGRGYEIYQCPCPAGLAGYSFLSMAAILKRRVNCLLIGVVMHNKVQLNPKLHLLTEGTTLIYFAEDEDSFDAIRALKLDGDDLVNLAAMSTAALTASHHTKSHQEIFHLQPLELFSRRHRKSIQVFAGQLKAEDVQLHEDFQYLERREGMIPTSMISLRQSRRSIELEESFRSNTDNNDGDDADDGDEESNYKIKNDKNCNSSNNNNSNVDNAGSSVPQQKHKVVNNPPPSQIDRAHPRIGSGSTDHQDGARRCSLASQSGALLASLRPQSPFLFGVSVVDSESTTEDDMNATVQQQQQAALNNTGGTRTQSSSYLLAQSMDVAASPKVLHTAMSLRFKPQRRQNRKDSMRGIGHRILSDLVEDVDITAMSQHIVVVDVTSTETLPVALSRDEELHIYEQRAESLAMLLNALVAVDHDREVLFISNAGVPPALTHARCFENVVCMYGSVMDEIVLQDAGVHKACAICVFAPRILRSDGGDHNIMQLHAKLTGVLAHHRAHVPIVVEVENISTMAMLGPRYATETLRSSIDEDDVTALPKVVFGEVFSSAMLDNALFQCYFNKYLLEVVRCLVFGSEIIPCTPISERPSTRVNSKAASRCFEYSEGCTFLELFTSFVQTGKVLLGVFRAIPNPNETFQVVSMQNRVPIERDARYLRYFSTACDNDNVIQADDELYFLD